MAQVALHASASSCWTVIRGSVYDLTTWISQHPGGEQAILQLCGTDGTDEFVGQHGGSPQQENKLATFKIGVLAQ
jgi:cytochrome b involved in lipid metabolism